MAWRRKGKSLGDEVADNISIRRVDCEKPWQDLSTLSNWTVKQE